MANNNNIHMLPLVRVAAAFEKIADAAERQATAAELHAANVQRQTTLLDALNARGTALLERIEADAARRQKIEDERQERWEREDREQREERGGGEPPAPSNDAPPDDKREPLTGA